MRLHAFEDGAYDSADDSGFGGFPGTFAGEILLDLVGEAGDGKGFATRLGQGQ